MKTETAELQIIDSTEFGIEAKKAKEITSGLTSILSEREILQEAYKVVLKLEVVPENVSQFKELRLKIRDNRTKGIDAWHKVNKDFYLKGGQFVDAIKRKEVLVNEQMEEKLLEAEKHFENLEAQRLIDLNNSRKEAIAPYVSDLGLLDFSNMPDDVWVPYFESKKKAHEEQIAIDKAEAVRLEAERVAREKEIETQRLENIRLKAEADAKEKIRQARGKEMQPYIVYIRDYNKLLDMSDAEFTKEMKAIQRGAMEQMKYEAEKLQAEETERIAEAKRKQQEFEKATEERLNKEAELKVENERLAKEKAEKLEAEKLAKAPIKEQLNIWVNCFEIPLPKEANETTLDIAKKFNSFKEWAKTEIDKL